MPTAKARFRHKPLKAPKDIYTSTAKASHLPSYQPMPPVINQCPQSSKPFPAIDPASHRPCKPSTIRVQAPMNRWTINVIWVKNGRSHYANFSVHLLHTQNFLRKEYLWHDNCRGASSMPVHDFLTWHDSCKGGIGTNYFPVVCISILH